MDDKARRGLIPWSAKEFYEVWGRYAVSKSKSKNKDVDKTLLLGEVFHKKYPNELEFMAHLYRFQLMRMFVFKYGRQLGKDGLYAPEGEAGFRDELMDCLCTLPYSKEEKGEGGNKTYTFLYSQIKNMALKRINAHLN